MKQLSQTELYGELLTNEQHYNKEIGVLDFVGLTDEQESVLVQCARQGDVQAGHDFIMALVPYVAKFVTRRRRLLWAKGIDVHRLEYLDLVQVASLAMLEKLPTALDMDRPAAYLLESAYRVICQYCYRHESVIDTPQYSTPMKVESFHMLMTHDGDAEFLETIAQEEPACTASTRDFHPLYQAIEALPPMQKRVIVAHYGLLDSPCEELRDLNRQWYAADKGTHCSDLLRRALFRLHRATACSYVSSDEQETGKHLLEGRRRVRTTPVVKLLAGHYDKLEQAHQRLVQRSERVSSRTLQKEAHVSTDAAKSYLYQYREQHPQPTRYERLEEAYARLQAIGEKITTRSVALAAGVERSVASAYLNQRQARTVQRMTSEMKS